MEQQPVSVAPKAKEWITRERPAILAAVVRAKCADDDTSCVAASEKLEKLHPGTPEATEAKALREAWRKRADERAEVARKDAEKGTYPARSSSARSTRPADATMTSS